MQDHVGYDRFPYKVNAISLLEFSSELKTLCVNSGGKQIRVTKRKELYAYSSEGEEKLN